MNATDDQVKERYKELAKALHSDKLSAKELPDQVLKLTEEQFKKVQEAYDEIKKLRGMA